ncbi:MAG: YSC84-related protein [Proteobacteria bacterium]|nr:YSC84-related protein [Pseudomonadota bacterium]
MNALINLKLVWLLGILLLGLQGCATLTTDQIDQQRAETREMADQTLAQVKQQYPSARSKLNKAAGYAVFSNFGFKFMFGGSSRGKGLAFNNATKQTTFMRMIELQPGFGFGVQKFRIVFIFTTPEAYSQFVNSGWQFGASTTASLNNGTQGLGGGLGVVVSPGVEMYQISETGAIVGISISGAKYYKDDELN